MKSKRAKQKNKYLMLIPWEQTVNPRKIARQDKVNKSQVFMMFYLIVFEW